MQNQPYPGAQPAYGGSPPQGQPGYPAGGVQGYPPGAGYPQASGYAAPGGAAQGYPQPANNPGYSAPSASAPPAGAVPSGYAPPSGAAQGYPQPIHNPGYPPAPSASAPPAGAVPAGAVPPGGPPPPGTEYRDDVNWDLEPTAPPMEKMDMIPGYESGFLAGGELAPPSYTEAMKELTPPDRTMNTNMPSLTEDEAKEALLQEVSSHCCYGTNAARDMVIAGLDTTMAFHYKLESFTEMRATTWAVEPYSGQPIDGPHNGPAPSPWNVLVYASKTFENSAVAVEVPHTASVKPCHSCIGLGRVRCHHCHGMGNSRCTWCHGSGRKTVHRDGQSHRETCSSCHGSGHSRCSWCHGTCIETCKTCTGRGQLKCYIKLTVTWKNHDDDHILERTDLPDKLIKKATGVIAFEEEAQLVWPVNHFPEASINQASNSMVTSHRTKWPNERILLQRHKVRIVPVTQAHYRWNNKSGSYFIYGNQHLVHAPDYPQQCCCGCTIL